MKGFVVFRHPEAWNVRHGSTCTLQTRLWFNDVINRLDHRLYMVHTLGLHQQLQRVCTTQKSFPNFEMVHKVSSAQIDQSWSNPTQTLVSPMLLQESYVISNDLLDGTFSKICFKGVLVSKYLTVWKLPSALRCKPGSRATILLVRILAAFYLLILTSINPIPSSPHILIIHLTKRDSAKF